MAANDEFPRGTSQMTSAGPSGTATIIIPANSLVAHVIDRIFVKSAATAATAAAIALSLTTPSLGNIDATGLFTEATISAVDTYERDVNIEAPPGDSVTLTFTNGANNSCYISMAWHDI